MCDCNELTLPIGPQGPQGVAGINGTNGSNGTNGTNGAPGMAWYSLDLDYYVSGGDTHPYTEVAKFIYPGSSNVTAITKLYAILYTTDTGFTGKVRVIDQTHGDAVIADFTTGTSSTSNLNIIDLGAISNIPASISVFSIQLYNSGSLRSNEVHIKSLMISSY